MFSLLIAFLIFVVIVCVIAYIVVWILSNVPGIPAGFQRLVWAVAGIAILLWLLSHLTGYVH